TRVCGATAQRPVRPKESRTQRKLVSSRCTLKNEHKRKKSKLWRGSESYPVVARNRRKRVRQEFSARQRKGEEEEWVRCGAHVCIICIAAELTLLLLWLRGIIYKARERSESAVGSIDPPPGLH
ncbi:unnamed protein product, partial [Ectocarpus sp. 6 AP-2014]